MWHYNFNLHAERMSRASGDLSRNQNLRKSFAAINKMPLVQVRANINISAETRLVAVLLVVGRRHEIRGTVYCSKLRVRVLSSAPCVFWVLPSLYFPSRGFPCVPFFLCASVAAAC